MNLYVLAEKRALHIDAQSGCSREWMELFTFPSQTVGDRIALFVSTIDAELCRQYLNRQSDGHRKNNYEIRPHVDSVVAFNVTTLHEDTGMGVGLIIGFNTDADGQLYIQDRAYKLAAVALPESEMRRLFVPPQQPGDGFKSSLLTMLLNYESKGSRSTFGAFSARGFLDELDQMATLAPEQIDQIAEVALAQTGALLVGQADGLTLPGLSIYSVHSNSWQTLV